MSTDCTPIANWLWPVQSAVITISVIAATATATASLAKTLFNYSNSIISVHQIDDAT